VFNLATKRPHEFWQGERRQSDAIPQAHGQRKMRVETRIRLRVPEIEPSHLRMIFERTKLKPNLGRLLTFRNLPPGRIRVKLMHSHEQQAVLIMVDERVKRVKSSFLKRMTVDFHGRIGLCGYYGVDFWHSAVTRRTAQCRRASTAEIERGTPQGPLSKAVTIDRPPPSTRSGRSAHAFLCSDLMPVPPWPPRLAGDGWLPDGGADEPVPRDQ
jgi:hypothetical protein